MPNSCQTTRKRNKCVNSFKCNANAKCTPNIRPLYTKQNLHIYLIMIHQRDPIASVIEQTQSTRLPTLILTCTISKSVLFLILC